VGPHQPSTRTIIGVAVLLFGAILFGVGIHHLVATGTCSSTGYSANYGPVPYCPKGTGYWFLFLFGGIFMVIIGGLVSGASSVILILPTVFLAIGIGSLTVAFDSQASSGSKTFALIFGGAFALFGAIPAFFVGVGAIRKLGGSPRSSPGGGSSGGSLASSSLAGGGSLGSSAFGGSTSQPDAILGAYAASPTITSTTLAPQGTSPATPTAPSMPISSGRSSNDVLDKIARLSELHKSGALTDEEFNREKAKLLSEL